MRSWMPWVWWMWVVSRRVSVCELCWWWGFGGCPCAGFGDFFAVVDGVFFLEGVEA